MRFVSKWIYSPQDRAIARFLVAPEDFFYGESLDGLNIGHGVVAFGSEFEDPNAWLQWTSGGLHYYRDGIDQGELGSGGGGGTTFLALTDTPASYAGDGGAVVIVNQAETGLVFQEVVFRVPEPIEIGDILYSGDGTTWSIRPAGLLDEVLTIGDIGAGELGPVWAEAAVDWADISGIPSEFPPSAHAPSHELGGVDPLVIDWSQLDDIPTEFPPALHGGTHELGGLDEITVDWTQLQNVPPPFGETFLDLTDTPVAYGTPGFATVVNGAGDGLIFVDLNPGGGGDLPPGTAPNQMLRWGGATWTPTDVMLASLVQASFFGAPLTGQPDGLLPGPALELLGLAANVPDYTFLDLGDTPIDYTGAANQLVSVTAGEDGLEFVPVVSGVTEFIALTDTPPAYIGFAGDVVVVNPGEDALQFVPLSAGGAQQRDYRWTTSIATADPGSGMVGVNNADPTLATVVHVSAIDDNGNPVALFDFLTEGDFFWIADFNSPDIHEYKVIGPAVDQGAWDSIPVEHLETTGGFINNERVVCAALFLSAHTFVELFDTPDDYVGAAGLYPRVVVGETGLEFDAVSFLDLTDVPATFPPSAHDQPFTTITGQIADAQVPLSAVAQYEGDLAIDWDQLIGVQPPPVAHTHPFTDITGEIADAQVPSSAVVQHEDGLSIDWSQLVGVPGTFPPENHTHPFTEITGQIANNQVPESAVTQHEAALGIDWAQLSGVPASFPPSPHTHVVADITDFPVIVSTFLELTDTPLLYGDPGQVVVMNGTGDGLLYVTFTPPGVGFNYIYTPPGTGDPAAGEFEFNHPDPSLATEFAVNEIDDGGNFSGAYFPFVQQGDWVILAGATAAGGGSFIADGPGVEDTGVWTIPIQGAATDSGLTLGLPYRTSIQRPAAGIVDWDDIVGKPATFPPSPHTHDTADIISGVLVAARGGTGVADPSTVGNVLRSTGVAWASSPLDFTDLTGVNALAQVPVATVTQHQAALSIDYSQLVGTQPPPLAHTQDFTTITGTNADAQVIVSNVVQHQAGLSIGWAQLTGIPATFPPSAHGATHSPGGADPVTLNQLTGSDLTYNFLMSVNGASLLGIGANDLKRLNGIGRLYLEVYEGGNSGTWQSQGGSWPSAQVGWVRGYARSGGNGLGVTYSDGRQETVSTVAFADEEEGVAETPNDYLIQEIFVLTDRVNQLALALSNAAIPLPGPFSPDPYAAHSSRARKAPYQPGLTP